MNVYYRASGWGTLVALILFAGVLVLDIWLMDKLPLLRHGFRLPSMTNRVPLLPCRFRQAG